MLVTGAGVGTVFVDHYLRWLARAPGLTKLALRNSSLQEAQVAGIASFMLAFLVMQEFDASENALGAAAAIIDASVGHQSLQALQLEGAGVNDSARSSPCSRRRSDSTRCGSRRPLCRARRRARCRSCCGVTITSRTW